MVQISSTTAEQNPNDNMATATTSLGEIANLYTTLTLTPSYTLGASLEATLHYGNNGNKDIYSGKVSLHLNEHLSPTSVSLSGYELSGNTLIWNIAQLPQGASGTITLQLQVDHTTDLVDNATPLFINASITSPATEINLLDNIALAKSEPLQ
ncbi:MAG: DUF11 domain-containing protein [Candidatus Peribacteria bacterium]|jgi:hypothetical protein|nr:DUF11 domain-containing protein [Candidatus Peribacteria bacterium]